MAKKKISFRDKVASAAKKAKQATNSFGYLTLPKGVQVFSPKPGGRAWLDFLQYKVSSKNHPDRDDSLEIAIPGTYWYRRPFKVHRNVGPNNTSVVCLSSFGKKCPICEYRAKLIKEGAEKEATDDLRPSSRVLYAVIPLKDKDFEEEVHVWDMSHYLFQSLLDDELNEDPDMGIFPDLEEGFTLKIRFDSNTFGGSKPFAKATRIDFIEREEAYDESILDKVPDLDAMLQEMSYEAMEKLFFELDDGDVVENGEEEPEEEEPKKPERKVLRRKKKTVKKAPEPEEPEELEEEESEEPEEPKKPKGKVLRRKKAKKEEEEEEGETCPYGHKFGVDTDEFEDCDTCDLWDNCLDVKEG